MNIKQILVSTIKGEITALQAKLAQIESLSIPEELDISRPPTLYGQQIDFDHLPHEDVMKVVQAIPGKWNKTPAPSGARINYELETGGVKFRCYEGEPPPNCKIVEVLETVPAQPERTVTVRRLQCV
jgi:hypothetical protein